MLKSLKRLIVFRNGYTQVVLEAWAVVADEPDPFCRLVACLKNTARRLQSWSTKKIGDVSRQLLVARELIARLDAAQDFRPLYAAEAWLRRRLKGAYLGLASLERSISRQRIRLSWLRDSDAGQKFFRVHAVHRKQKNRIFELQVEATSVSNPASLAEAAYRHFSGILGSAKPRPFSLDLSALHVGPFDLSSLDAPFSEGEIWAAVKSLPLGKTPGPDGFTANSSGVRGT